jgi:hypothetical protein
MGGRDRGMGWAEGGMLDGWEGLRNRRMGSSLNSLRKCPPPPPRMGGFKE